MKNRLAKLTNPEVVEWVNRKLSELRSKSYEELRILPDWQAEDPPDERFGVQGVYRDALDDGRLKIVVQAGTRSWLGMSWVSANGFWISPSGELVDLPEKELWEFM